MIKKVFLVVFAVSILALVIGLFIWDSGESAQQGAVTQRALRLKYIEDQSPSLIAFDPLGRVWVYGSDDVLNKNGALVVYEDGKEIGRYTDKDSPILNWLPSFTSQVDFDKHGTVWIGTGGQDGGLARFDGDTWTSFAADSGLPSNWVTALRVDGQGRAWVGFYEHGLGVFDKGNWKYYTTENSGLSVNTIHDIAFDDQGRAWITTDRGGVNIFDGTDWQVLNSENSGLAHDQTDTIIFDDQGRAWIATWVDISVYNEGQNSWLHYPGGMEPGNNSMFFDASGRFWARRGMNIRVFDGEVWKYYFDPTFPVNLILPDPQGNIVMTNGYDEIRTVAAEDVNFNLRKASEGQAKAFVESGGLLVLTIILVLLWLTALTSSWWTMVTAVATGIPIYLIWNSMFGGSTPADAAFFSGSYVWNPGSLLSLSVLVFGMLGNRFKRSGRKGAEWLGIVLGLTLGIILDCGLIFMGFIFMAK
jgi:ligand-binding sensor domain-containing protein